MINNKNMVTPKIIAEILSREPDQLEHALDIKNIESNEPMLSEAINEYCSRWMQQIAEHFPLVRDQHPRILMDFFFMSQAAFIKGFRLGTAAVRDQFGDLLDEMIDTTGMGDPESDPESFK